MDEKNEELVDAQIVEEDSRVYGHAEGEPGGEVADEPALVLGDDDPHDAELHEKILSEECAWKGKILDVHRLEVELPNGHRSARDIVRHPGAAAVVALTESGKIVLVRQYRTAIDRVTVEIPAGKLDPGEDPLDCAKRELHEETGFRAGRIRFLTSIVTSCGFCDEIIHIYLATKLEFDAPNPDDDEFVNVDLVPLHELIDAVVALDNIKWWHRIIEKKGFRLNGFINHYPDFMVMTKSGKLVLIEYKGDDRDNSNSARKLKLGRKWQAQCGPEYRYFMVFKNRDFGIDGAYTLDRFVGIMREL